MENQTVLKMRFNNVQALRAIACIFVILTHVEFIANGAFGVDIFFCITGCMLMLSTENGKSDNFIKKRLIRMLPLYYLMTLFTYFVMKIVPSMFQQVTLQNEYLIKSLLFIPFDITGTGVIQPLMRIGWTMNYDIFVTFVFALAMKISYRYRGIIFSGILCVLVMIHGFLPSYIPLQYFSDSLILEFVFGVLAYYLVNKYYLKSRRCITKYKSYSLIVFAVLLLMLMWNMHMNVPYRLIQWGIPSVLILLCFMFTEGSFAVPDWIIGLGNISFSIYLIHYYPIQLAGRLIFHFETMSMLSVFGVIVTTLFCIFVAYISWMIIEKRMSAFLIKKFVTTKEKC